MSFVSECPSCGQQLKIPDNLVGKSVKCSKCSSVFTAQAFTENPPLAPPSPSRQSRPRAEELAADTEPQQQRRSSPTTSGSDMPGRGGLLLTLGICSIAAPIVGLLIHVIGSFIVPFLGICGAVVVVAGLVLGIVSWVMSSGDLKRIRAGSIEASAEGKTRAGLITGIIGTILNASYFLCGCIIAILAIIIGGTFAAMLGLGIAAAQKVSTAPKPPNIPVPRRSHQPAPIKLSYYLPDHSHGSGSQD